MASTGFNVATCTNCGQQFNPPILGRTFDTCEQCRRGVAEVPSMDAAIPSVAAPARKLDATTVLLAINVLVFVLMVLRGVSPLTPCCQWCWQS